MIPKYRKQAVVRVVPGLPALFAALAVMVFTEHRPQAKLGLKVAILLAIGG